MEKALIGLSFDDGRLDNYEIVYPILKKYNIPATFNITSGFVERIINKEKFDFPEAMTLTMIKELYNDANIEIAGHGHLHENSKEDILMGINHLCSILGVDSLYKEGCGFASPGSDLSLKDYLEMKDFLNNNNVIYIRLSLRYNTNVFFKTFLRKISRIIKLPFLYSISYKDTLMTRSKDGVMYSIPILYSTTIGQIKSIVELAIKEKNACLLMFHSIIASKNKRDNWYYDAARFEDICKMLVSFKEKGLINVEKSIDIFNTIRE